MQGLGLSRAPGLCFPFMATMTVRCMSSPAWEKLSVPMHISSMTLAWDTSHATGVLPWKNPKGLF